MAALPVELPQCLTLTRPHPETPEPKYDSYQLIESRDWAGRRSVQILVTYRSGSHPRRFGNGFADEAAALKYLRRFHPDLLDAVRKE